MVVPGPASARPRISSAAAAAVHAIASQAPPAIPAQRAAPMPVHRGEIAHLETAELDGGPTVFVPMDARHEE